MNEAKKSPITASLDKYLISVVIAVKDPEIYFLKLCLASFACLSNSKYLQIVIVGSGVLPDFDDNTFVRFGDFKVIDVPAEGVYSAYNAGIKSSDGTYILFFGFDDIALPGMDGVIFQLASSPVVFHLFAAACYMQSVGVAEPSQLRLSLILRNWCHQGIFYLRSYMLDHFYETDYSAQADHKMNIDIVSDRSLRFGISKELVSYFSAGGFSSLRPDLRFRKDFPSIVGKAYGRPYGWSVKLKQLLIDALLGKPEYRFQARHRR